MKRWWVLGCVLIMATAATAGTAVAKDKAPAKPKQAEQAAPPAEAEAADAAKSPPEEPVIPHITGPKTVDLGHHAQIDLPAGMVLLEQQAAQDLMRKWGNSPEGVVAVIAPQSDASWWVSIDASDEGYVDDDDADDLDAKTMLEQIKQGTLEQNKTRVSIGVPEYFADDWRDPPRYQAALHRLVWGINGHNARRKSVNFSTRFLGRNGYLAVDLIDATETIEQSKIQALAILNAVHFAPGFRYEDHVGSDHSSGLGLKALVLGGTAVVLAKKGGILIAILLALKKGVIVIAVAIGAFFKRMFRGKPTPPPQVASYDPPAGAPPSDLGPPPGPPSAGG